MGKTLLSAMYIANDPFFLFDNTVPVVMPEALEEFDPKDTVLLLWGGADISPYYYNEVPVYTNAKYWPSDRDWREALLIRKAKELGMPMIGICRGAQFICCLAGGKLFQDVGGHEGNHRISTNNGMTLVANSTHHQMMVPNEEGEVLAWSTEPMSKKYLGQDGLCTPPEKEVEVVWWKNWKALGIQGHPEYMGKNSPFVRYTQQLVRKYIFNE